MSNWNYWIWKFWHSVNDEHPEKAEFPFVVTEDGIEICFKDEHSLNVESSIDFTEHGIDISVKDEHPKNA